MLSISRSDDSKIINSILKKAIEFPSQEAYDAYMKQHPDADPKHHKVVKKEDIKQEIKDTKNELKRHGK